MGKTGWVTSRRPRSHAPGHFLLQVSHHLLALLIVLRLCLHQFIEMPQGQIRQSKQPKILPNRRGPKLVTVNYRYARLQQSSTRPHHCPS
ncbi:hypothetical protein E2C01_009083 [Portunus trituberculatus]|uniref:Secreted protein n=1 Tax=Portunus trituberculatus TaxID=210409 RepID=A0A5B7D2I5_PORTR|nr:hypothetical protein [Portunus trituberculatus]